MRNLTICDIRLHASTEVAAFERAMTADVLPHAGDELQNPDDTLFVRSLYRASGDEFPPRYRCVVDSTWVTDSGFFRMREKIRDLGADPSRSRFRLMFDSLPDHDQALAVLRTRPYRGMVMLDLHLPFGAGEPQFEEALLAALKDEVGVATRVNNVYAAFWTRDDEIVVGNTEYLVIAIGDFLEPRLRPHTLEKIVAASGKVADSQLYHRVHVVPGPDPAPPPGPSELLATIPVAMAPGRVAIAPDGSRAYVTLTQGVADGPDVGAVAVISTATREVVATVPVGSMPAEVVVSPDGLTLYVPCWDGLHARGILSIIDVTTNTVTASLVVSGRGGGPTGAAIKPDGTRVYVSTQSEAETADDRGKVTVIDTATREIVATIAINPFPSGLGMTPDGGLVYALDTGGSPAVIDTSTNEATFPFLSTPVGDRIAFTPDGALAYMIKDADTVIIGIEVATNRLLSLLDTDNGLATDLAITPDGRLVYVTDRTHRLISVVKVGVIDEPATHPTHWSGSANGIAIMPDGRTAFVTDQNARAVRVIAMAP